MIFEMFNISTLIWLVLGIVLLFPIFPLSLGAFAAGLCAWLGYGIVRQLIAACMVPLVFAILIFVIAGLQNEWSRSKRVPKCSIEKQCQPDCLKEKK